MTSPNNRKPIEVEPRTEGFGNTADLTRFAGWSAFVSAAAAVLGLVAFSVFMMAGDPFGTLADVTGLALGLSILPVAWGLHSLYRARLGRGSQVIVAIGLLAYRRATSTDGATSADLSN